MEPTQLVSERSPSGDGEQRQSNECEELIASLPKIIPSWGPGGTFYQYQGFWIPAAAIKGIISSQKHFKARHTDIVVASSPKSGTTWLESLTFTIVNRNKYDPLSTTHPLLISHPKDLVCSLEFDYYPNGDSLDLQHLPDPRILETHAPFPLLPPSIMDSNCRIIYICRNPFDQFTSYWRFLGHLYSPAGIESIPLEENFEMFCEGTSGFGPFWDHVLGYWNESLQKPDKILFFKYEDMKSDVTSHCKKLAEFVGFPFTEEEQKQGVVEGIAKLCSFENLKNLEVNKTGLFRSKLPNSAFFRKGEVGDSANYLTPPMTERMDKILKDKYAGSLSFPVPCRVKGEVKD